MTLMINPVELSVAFEREDEINAGRGLMASTKYGMRRHYRESAQYLALGRNSTNR